MNTRSQTPTGEPPWAQAIEQLYNRLAEKSSADAAGLLEQFDNRLVARITTVEQNVSHQIADVHHNLSAVEVRLQHLEQALPVLPPGSSGDLPRYPETPPSPLRHVDEAVRQVGTAPSHSDSMRLKPPTFDGLGSWRSFVVQFETVALHNGWSSDGKAAALIAQLRGKAAECLEVMPDSIRATYESLRQALEARFNDAHLQQLHLTALKTYRQKTESLQELALAIERLAMKALAGCTEATLHLITTSAFVDAIKDTDVQRYVRLARPTTLSAALGHALEMEAASTATTSIVSQANRISLTGDPRDNHRRPESRCCFNCGRLGHLARACQSPNLRHQGNPPAGPRGQGPA